MAQEVIAYFSLGSNLGDKEQNLNTAVQFISNSGIKILEVSNFHNTSPIGFVSNNQFVNACLKVSTNLSPIDLLNALKSIEKKMGRASKSVGGIHSDRIIDIDILYFGSQVILTDELTIPHPELTKRHFVLAPLCELAPDFIHPISKISTSFYLLNLPSKS